MRSVSGVIGSLACYGEARGAVEWIVWAGQQCRLKGENSVDNEHRSFWKNPWVIGIGAPLIVALILAVVHGFGSPTPVPSPTPTVSPPTNPSSLKPRASVTATTSATPAVSGIFHQGRLELAFNTCADLDAPPSDSRWGELSANTDAGGGDLCSQYPSFVGVNSATLVTVNSGTDTTCQNATGWFAPNLYKDLNLSAGSFVCVHTNQGRYSLLRVITINSADNSIVFSVKTFKKSGD